MSSAFNPATRAFDIWLSRRCNEALAAEVLKIRAGTLPADRVADARHRLANFLAGVFAGAQAAGDEVIAGMEADGVDFASLADKCLSGIARREA